MKIDSAKYTKNKDVIIIQFPYGKYDFDEMENMFKNIKSAFPENILLAMPEDISFSILREENPFL